MEKGKNNNSSFINAQTMFNTRAEGGSQRPFLSTATRFDYFKTPQKMTKKMMPKPSPGQYKIRDTFGDEAVNQN